MTIDDIRRENLRLLSLEYGSQNRLSEILGISPSQLGQWINGSKNSRSGRPRGMVAESARKIEVACKKPIGWLDVSHAVRDQLPTDIPTSWPFRDVSYLKLRKLSERDIGKLEAVLLMAARDFALDIKNNKTKN